jgi:flavin-binding protein dodecin
MNSPKKPSDVVRMGGKSFRSWCDAVLKAVADAPEPTRSVAELDVLDRNQEVREGRTEYYVFVEIVYEADEFEPTSTATPSC